MCVSSVPLSNPLVVIEPQDRTPHYQVTCLGTVANDPCPLVVVAGEIPGLVVVMAAHGQIIPRTLVPRIRGRSHIRTTYD